MAADSEYDPLVVIGRQQWREWLQANHDTSSGVVLIIRKKGSGRAGLSYDEAVEEALCFGWIDSRAKTLDNELFSLRFSPRRAGGGWAQSNKLRVEKLVQQGLMTDAGLTVIEAAKRDGSWNALDEIDALAIPDDLCEALAADRVAEANFAAFSDSAKKMILFWIASAKRPETRAKRIAATVANAHDNIKDNLYRPQQTRG